MYLFHIFQSMLDFSRKTFFLLFSRFSGFHNVLNDPSTIIGSSFMIKNVETTILISPLSQDYLVLVNCFLMAYGVSYWSNSGITLRLDKYYLLNNLFWGIGNKITSLKLEFMVSIVFVAHPVYSC